MSGWGNSLPLLAQPYRYHALLGKIEATLECTFGADEPSWRETLLILPTAPSPNPGF